MSMKQELQQWIQRFKESGKEVDKVKMKPNDEEDSGTE